MIPLMNENGNIYYVLENELQYYTDRKATEEEILNEKELQNIETLRTLRLECFEVVNRGTLWFERLSDEQKLELDEWYQAWLDVTETKVIPKKPEWLN